jgi:hypothetical protein
MLGLSGAGAGTEGKQPLATMPATQPKIPDGDEDMAARIRAHDWPSTLLGPITAWPAALRVALTLAEKATYPTAIYAGTDFRLIYNDA